MLITSLLFSSVELTYVSQICRSIYFQVCTKLLLSGVYVILNPLLNEYELGAIPIRDITRIEQQGRLIICTCMYNHQVQHAIHCKYISCDTS